MRLKSTLVFSILLYCFFYSLLSDLLDILLKINSRLVSDAFYETATLLTPFPLP
jgi:hypothetical protein